MHRLLLAFRESLLAEVNPSFNIAHQVKHQGHLVFGSVLDVEMD